MNKPLVRILVIFVAVLLGSGLLVYVLLERSGGGPGSGAVTEPVSTTEGQPGAPTGSPAAAARAPDNANHSVLSEIFGIDKPGPTVAEGAERGVVAARVLLRFLLAAFLAMLLAFRWRR